MASILSLWKSKASKKGVHMILCPEKDQQTVTPEGKKLSSIIAGVKIRKLVTMEDKRGELTEVYRPSWGMHEDPLVYVYQVVARPGTIRGWVVHEHQDDRIFCSSGVFRWALFDNRSDSPTYKLLNDFTFGERNPVIFTIPKGVFHAVKNIGTKDGVFLNMPTIPYNHQNPDKYRLPIKNDLIPFDFEDGPGW
jgi:dTDP-4-dehydrorhamnose 3,5-epimerase